MLLSLKVIKYKASQPDQPIKMDFHRQGGGIGRLPEPENRMHLPDPEKYISRKHAHIRFENGAFHLTDTSMAGTYFINKNKSVHNDTIRLADGDHLRIGDYELIVSLTDTTDSQPPSAPDLDETGGPSFFKSGVHPPETTDGSENTPAGEDVTTWPEQHPFEGPAESESFTPPEVGEQRSSNEIPEDFDINQLLSNRDETRLRKTFHKSAQPAPAPTSGAEGAMEPLLGIFLAAAGLEGDHIVSGQRSEDVVRTLGELFKALIGGLMTTLQARSKLKSQFRVSMTFIQPVENNPLKFSTRTEDALKQLLLTDDTAFLDPIEAVREGFEDIGNHQLALAAGIQSSLVSLLKKFDPIQFEKRFGHGLAIQRKAKSWSAYRDAYEDIVKEAMDDIYGTDFSCAYERQIQKLRSARQEPPKKPSRRSAK